MSNCLNDICTWLSNFLFLKQSSWSSQTSPAQVDETLSFWLLRSKILESPLTPLNLSCQIQSISKFYCRYHSNPTHHHILLELLLYLTLTAIQTTPKSQWLSATNVDYLLTWQWAGEGALIYIVFQKPGILLPRTLSFSIIWDSLLDSLHETVCEFSHSPGLGVIYTTSDCFPLARSQSHGPA